jgi:hypothetical protein
MRTLLSAAIVASVIAVITPTDALACGGCFIPPGQMRSTQVSSHRMVMSIGKTSTTLWDQIQYVGTPSEFAWVLPIHGQVEVGVSSDLLFTILENETSVVVHSPQIVCMKPNAGGFGSGPCNQSYAATGASMGTGGTVSEDEGVEVLQQSVVGPYETVQLSSTDPMALRDWLTAHGYAVPTEIDPVLDAYVAEGSDFLAVRLVPGQGVDAMQPIRVTTPGASLDLPLRMVAAGAGAFTPITLWVIGEGRYTAANMTEFEIHADDLTWDFGQKRSNYAETRAAGVTANGGATWLVESALAKPPSAFQSIVSTATRDPAHSGYGSDPPAEAQADVDHAIGGLAPENILVTRLFATLPKAVLGTDLVLGASLKQVGVPRDLYLYKYIGDPCEGMGTPLPDCYSGPSTGSGAGGGGGSGSLSGSGCACTVGAEDAPLATLGFASGTLGLVFGAWRRVRRRGTSRSSPG